MRVESERLHPDPPKNARILVPSFDLRMLGRCQILMYEKGPGSWSNKKSNEQQSRSELSSYYTDWFTGDPGVFTKFIVIMKLSEEMANPKAFVLLIFWAKQSFQRGIQISWLLQRQIRFLNSLVLPSQTKRADIQLQIFEVALKLGHQKRTGTQGFPTKINTF